jgi:hypothetical protein
LFIDFCGVLLFVGYELWCIALHVSMAFGTNLCFFVLYFGGVLHCVMDARVRK